MGVVEGSLLGPSPGQLCMGRGPRCMHLWWSMHACVEAVVEAVVVDMHVDPPHACKGGGGWPRAGGPRNGQLE